MLGVDQPPEEAVNVVLLDGKGEVTLQVIDVELLDEVDLALISGLGTNDNACADQCGSRAAAEKRTESEPLIVVRVVA